MAPKWQSQKIYEHPAKHNAGIYGYIIQTVGVYALKVGGSHMSCPQDWAAKIHHDEMEQNEELVEIITRKIPESLRREFKIKCAQEGASQQDKVIELITRYINAKKD